MKQISRAREVVFDWLSSFRGILMPSYRRESSLFETRAASHMYAGREQNRPFDNDSYFFEPILGGDRVFAYLNREKTSLAGPSGAGLLDVFPELADLHQHVSGKCVLDGEIVIFKDGVPRPAEYAIRQQLQRPEAIRRAMDQFPAVFVAHDVIYWYKGQLTELPLLDRREILEKLVCQSHKIALSRFLRGQGATLFNAVRLRSLAGVTAKHKTSQYYFGYKTPDWIAIKDRLQDDYILCGYTGLANHPATLVLGQYGPCGEISFCGRVSFRGSEEEKTLLLRQRRGPGHPFQAAPPLGSLGVTWLAPSLTCSVSFAARDERGNLYDAAYQSLVPDKPLAVNMEQRQARAFDFYPGQTQDRIAPWH